MALGSALSLRNSKATATRDAYDAGAGPGVIRFYAGQRPPTVDDPAIPSTAWAGSTSHTVGDLIVPTTSNGHYYRATVAGTSGSSEPTWPTDGSTVTDGGVTWEDYGLVPTLLGIVTCADPCGTVANGVLTFGDFTQDSAADADGTAAWARGEDSTGAAVHDYAVTATGGGGDITLNTTTIVTGGPIDITSLTITEG